MSTKKASNGKVSVGGYEHTPSSQFTIFETRNYEMFQPLPHNRKVNKRNVNALKKSMGRRKNLFNVIIVNENMEVIDGQHRLDSHKEIHNANSGIPYDERQLVYYVICEGYGLSECRVLNQAGKNWSGLDFMDSFADSGLKSYQEFREFLNKYEFLDYWITLRILSGKVNTTTRAKSKTKSNQSLDINELFREGRFETTQEYKDYGELLAQRVQDIIDNKWYDGEEVSRTFIVAFSRMMDQKNFDFEVFKSKMSRSNRQIHDVQKMNTIAEQIESIYNEGEPASSCIKIVANVKSKNKSAQSITTLNVTKPKKKKVKKTTV